MFGNGRRRSFDRQNDNEQNSTGYREKTVFSTEFGSPETNNYQNGYAQNMPQNNGFDGGYAQSPAPNYGGYEQPSAPQSYAYAQSAAPVATAPAGELPMVFASNKHPDMYVYEYSDRLEWYLKTSTSMYLFNTVKK
ncbi:MAG: hypothetical protein K2M47_06045 [Clostridiales bacterium]|nr:hypothetical protein [Clostridiales bacterium]